MGYPHPLLTCTSSFTSQFEIGKPVKSQEPLQTSSLTWPVIHLNQFSFREEVWLHEDCICWSPGVYMIGFDIYGLEEIFKVARFTVSLT